MKLKMEILFMKTHRHVDLEKLEEIKRICFLHLLEDGLLSKSSFDLDPEKMTKLYSRAYQLYTAGKFQNAQAIFSLLALVEYNEFNFIYGWASCCLMLKEYEKAAEGYIRCGMLDLKNPLPYFYAADCYLNKQERVSACIALQIVIRRAQLNSQYSEIQKRAEMTLETLMPSQQKNKTAEAS
ncbi:putative regulatory protein lcrH and chaperone sycD [Candidatus Protochlamydia amoebophila]|jgi:type III secretion system low calcium response chaperone LcrH/SycD|uniref:Putative regulatory protein lcrH and chaperone sycD n=3 Tax=Candidatus Protochlamydia TaxID=282132 RepID=A0A0C1H7X0_9BACT|nr:putative regulatory protein lcrH and chaperone sycD [Candidatus Protochlamydia amoebophila]